MQTVILCVQGQQTRTQKNINSKIRSGLRYSYLSELQTDKRIIQPINFHNLVVYAELKLVILRCCCMHHHVTHCMMGGIERHRWPHQFVNVLKLRLNLVCE